MSKIRVIQHSKSCSYSGTDRTAALLAKYLDKNRFDVFLVYREPDSANNRLDVVKEWLGEDHVIPYQWNPGKKIQQPPHFPEYDNFFEVVSKINPQIAHFHFSGRNEFPVFKWLVPNAKIVTTNIFGYKDDANQSDQIIYISEYNRIKALQQKEKDGFVLPNPIESPIVLDKKYCRSWLTKNFGIPKDGILGLRVGRPDNPEQISIKAFAEVLKTRPNTHYLIVGPCAQWRAYAKDVGNIHFIDQITDDYELAILHNAADIYLHARNDGEICSTAIQQAMMYSLPIISHRSKIYNGQVEMLQDVGYCVGVGDFEQYTKILLELIDNESLRNEIGQKAFAKAITNYEAKIVAKRLEQIYDQVIQR